VTAVAVTGAACELPGAHSLEELWSNVLAQRAAFRAVPRERLDLTEYAPGIADEAETIAAQVAALIADYTFPRERYRIPASTYRQVDIAHWLALDVAARAIEDAQRRAGPLPRDRTAVIVANTLTGEMTRAHALRHRWPYVRRVVAETLRERGETTAVSDALLDALEQRFKAPFPPAGDEALAGSLANTIAGRIANAFDFGGGAHVVDGACASSLVAIATACTALECGEVDAVVTGAVDVSLDPFELIGFSRLGALATDDMRVYSQRPAGFLPGEGAAFIVLRRAADASRSLATIRGWATSSDGAGGITRPELKGQLRVLRRAYARAACDPRDVAYFEGHGTGTAIGDEVELAGLRGLRGEHAVETPAYVGSVKVLVGHTKAAAGMAGLLKVLMALRREIVPPHPVGAEPHPALGDGLDVVPRATLWPAGRPLIAGVSAFGFGGVNAHIIVERRGSRRRNSLARRELRQSRSPQDAELVLVGAPDGDTLVTRLTTAAAEIAMLSRAELTDYAVRSVRDAVDDEHRAAFVVEHPWRVGAALARAYRGSNRRAPKIALLFPGQASAVRFGAGALGRRFPELESAFMECAVGDVASTAIGQPAIVAASLAGLDLLRAMAIDGEVALGHSLGELVALHWAGALDRVTLQRLVRERGAIMESHCVRGAMAALATGAAAAARLLRGEAVIACDNGPHRCVVAGTPDAIDATLGAARNAGVEGVRMPVTTAFHSPLIEPAREPFRHSLAAAHLFTTPTRAIASTVLGRRWSRDDDVAGTLLDQLTAPVRFSAALDALGDVDLAVEVGAGETMRALVTHAGGPPVITLDVGGESMRGPLEVAAFVYARTGDAGAARALAAERFVCRLPPAADRTFFVNPCGASAPADYSPRAAACAATEPKAPAAEPAAPSGKPALDIVRELVARRVELPIETITSETRLLKDLHLSSLAVGQLLARLGTAFDVGLPADHLSFATASIGELAAAFERYRAAGRSARPAVDGVAPWVRRFTVVDVPVSERPPETVAHDWIYRSHGSRAFADALRGALAAAPDAPRAYALHLDGDDPAGLASRLLDFAHEVAADPLAARVLVVLHGTPGASFMRSFALEHLTLPTYVAVVDADSAPNDVVRDLVAEASVAETFTERIVYGGRRFRQELRIEDERATAADSLSGDDVLLVSGGGKGIAAECAFQRALATGAALILLGRSAPDHDEELARNLARFDAAGIRFRYVRADVRDAAAVLGAVAAARTELGTVTAILHGAGVNVPATIDALTPADIEEAIAVKVAGLEHLVAACNRERLREIVAFGSIISHTGMHGEAHYALANELLAARATALARELPSCRVATAAWSIWSGVGMGERLGRIDALARIGVAAIPPDRGVTAYLELAGDPHARGEIILGGRIGGLLTVRLADEELPLGRFLERTQIFFPRTELVVDAMLNRGNDPYLADHLIDGLAVVPGVILIEAMAQAATALLGAPPAEVTDVVFTRPVILGDDGRRTIRTAALREGDTVRIEIRSDDSAFGFVHASARMRRAATAKDPFPPLRENGSGSLPTGTEVYGSILFHRGRFAGIRAFRSVDACRCVAVTAATTAAPWFGAALPQAKFFGDPALRDMAIHAVQACVPHERVLPARIAGISRFGTPDSQELIIDAREVSHDAQGYVFDVEVRGAEGRVLERIAGLELRRSSSSSPQPVPPSLVATSVERRLLDAGLDGLRIEGFAPSSGDQWEHHPDGRPTNGSSRCRTREIELQCTSDSNTVGIDAEFAAEADAAGWYAVTANHRDAERCAAELASESRSLAQTRVWCALEAAKKAESTTPAQIAVSQVVRNSGLTIFTTGFSEVTTLTVRTTSAADPLVVAVARQSSPTHVGEIAS